MAYLMTQALGQTAGIAAARHVVRKAVESPEGFDEAFELMRQPILSLAEDPPEVSHYELLLRMRDPGGETISPAVFVPALREMGMEQDVDRWVADRAVLMLTPSADGGPQLEINVFAQTMRSAAFFDHLTTALTRRGVGPDALIVELAEGSKVDPSEMHHLSRRRFRTAKNFGLEEFESDGFAAITHQEVPCDLIKIGGELVRDLPSDPGNLSVVRRAAMLASRVGIATVAMRVEDAATVALLREAGVDYGQGFHLGRPERLKGREA